MAKLSKAQRDVLRRMDAGETLVHYMGIYSSWFHFEKDRVNSNTVEALEKRKLIEITRSSVQPGGSRFVYTLTEAGRAAIEKDGE